MMTQVFIDELNLHTVKKHDTRNAGYIRACRCLFHKDLKELKDDFFKKFTLEKAAGGFVLNE
jgi:hypothetical protein